MVISAGLAELAAGSIAMGVGGFLAAKDTKANPKEEEPKVCSSGSYTHLLAEEDASDVESRLSEKSPSRTDDGASSATLRYLAPLELSPELSAMVLEHIADRKRVEILLEEKERSNTTTETDEEPCSPLISGLSIAMGYLVGGLLPLLPYLFVSQVGDGLRISFGVCVLALFLYGFTRAYLSNADGADVVPAAGNRRRWQRIRRSIWEGFVMCGLGMAAALAAVVCVMLTPKIVGTSE